MSFEEVVDKHVADRIVWALGGPYFALALRQTSRRYAAMIPPPVHVSDTRDIARVAAMLGNIELCEQIILENDSDEDKSLEMMDYIAGIAACYDRRDICKLVVDKNTECYDAVLFGAAQSGHRELCELAIGWLTSVGAWRFAQIEERVHHFTQMIRGAALGGNIELFAQVGRWCEECLHALPNLGDVLNIAAEHGHYDICKLAYSWVSATKQTIDLEEMLMRAAYGGCKTTCELIKSWGARDFVKMLERAANGGNPETCVLARAWIEASGQRCTEAMFTAMMESAICASEYDTFILAHEWFTEIVKRPLTWNEICMFVRNAAQQGGTKICAFLCQLMCNYPSADENEYTDIGIAIVRMLNEITVTAVVNGYVDICELAHSCGCDNYEYYIQAADEDDAFRDEEGEEHVTAKVRALIQGWMAERDSA